jgi:hypothetical protein
MTQFATPLIKEPPIPERYIVRTTYVTCTSCGTNTATSEFLALSYAHARNHMGQPVRHYEACNRPEFNIPVEHVAAPPRTTAFCVRCRDIDLSHLPEPPHIGRLHDIAEPVLRTAPTKPRGSNGPAATPPKPRIEDLA